MSVEDIRVIGFDPGSLKAGWGIVSFKPRAAQSIAHVDNGIVVARGDTVEQRVASIASQVRDILVEYEPTVGVVENVFVHKGERSAVVLSQARGAIVAMLGLHGCEVHGMASTSAKKMVTGHGRARKELVADMMMRHLRLEAHPYEDAADALSLAYAMAFKSVSQGGYAESIVNSSSMQKRRLNGGSATRSGFAELARKRGVI